VTASCTPASGSTFPVGTTTVACTATDARSTTAGCSFGVTVSRIPTLTRTRFLAFGDSVTAGEVTVPVGGGVSERRFGTLVLVPSASYPTQLRTLLQGRYTAQAAAIEMTNAGRSGETAVEGAARFPGVMASVRPEVVLLLHGYNDLNSLGAAGISRAVSAMESMAKEGRARGARVFLANLTPPRPGGTNSIANTTTVEYNKRLETLAGGEGAVFVDLYSALLPGLTTFIGIDGLHPTEAGYRRMAEEFFERVRANLETP
jgi:lysophospholipase L1-like esterase